MVGQTSEYAFLPPLSPTVLETAGSLHLTCDCSRVPYDYSSLDPNYGFGELSRSTCVLRSSSFVTCYDSGNFVLSQVNFILSALKKKLVQKSVVENMSHRKNSDSILFLIK